MVFGKNRWKRQLDNWEGVKQVLKWITALTHPAGSHVPRPVEQGDPRQPNSAARAASS